MKSTCFSALIRLRRFDLILYQEPGHPPKKSERASKSQEQKRARTPTEGKSQDTHRRAKSQQRARTPTEGRARKWKESGHPPKSEEPGVRRARTPTEEESERVRKESEESGHPPEEKKESGHPA
ncbi:MAG: hypothetical protein GY732_22120 [Gammaproteobacteria bacterium]|nr:hypothetical protein [Gammaproteobacteria bacterium]